MTHVMACLDVVKEFSLRTGVGRWAHAMGLVSAGPTHRALDGVSLEVPRGRVEGVLGRNGAGKSTLLRVLGGVYPPTRGKVTLTGDAAGLFELGGLGSPALTGRAYAERFLRFMRTDRDSRARLIDDIREFTEIGHFFDCPIRTYSAGMTARLYFATLTAMHHQIYLIDELLAVGDEHFQGRCRERIRSRLQGGASGVLVTHDWTSVLRLCERAHVLDAGKLVFSGPSNEAVVRYLDIRPPEARRARFVESSPAEGRQGRCGKDLELEFNIEVLEPVRVTFNFSIEMLEVGIGWEILILGDRMEVGSEPGLYRVSVAIPGLPIRAGKYSLNTFLATPAAVSGGAAELLDIRSWTVGNALELNVSGEPTDVPVVIKSHIDCGVP